MTRSSRRRPTIAELRARVQKDRHREIGNWLARRVARPTAVYGCWLAIRLGSPRTRSLAASLSSLAAAVAIGTGTRLFVARRRTGPPGLLARPRRRPGRPLARNSQPGRRLPRLPDAPRGQSGLGFALGYGLAARSGDLRWTIAGFAIGAGWTLLSLHNDCRYKAFFQRLKAATASYRVDGGAGGRPQPPAPWPRRGLAAITWPAYKVCEPHVVLLGLTALALVAIGAPAVWLTSGKLGCSPSRSWPRARDRRIARAVRRGGRGRIRPLVPADRGYNQSRTGRSGDCCGDPWTSIVRRCITKR